MWQNLSHYILSLTMFVWRDLALILQGKFRWYKENQQRSITILGYYVTQMKLTHGVVESIITEVNVFQEILYN